VQCAASDRDGGRVLGIERARGAFRVPWAGAGGSEPGAADATAVVGAWGRWDALDRALERRFGRERARYLGWSGDYCAGAPGRASASGPARDEVRLYLFPGGYCGLSPIEGGRAHLAGVVSERLRRALSPGWPAVVAHARRTNRALDRDLSALPGEEGYPLGTGPVYFTRKPPVSGGVVLTGDAAGVLDPFSGEGQASALASGLLAGDVVARALESGSGAGALEADYARAWRRRFGRRFAWSAAFRRLVLSPRVASIAAAVAGESLLSLAIRKLEGA
jgi:flavin-dependent dehydrogenase